MRTAVAAPFIALLSALSAAAAGAVAPHASWTSLPVSNGYGVAVYDTALRRLTTFSPHLYQQWDETIITPDLLYDAWWGVRIDGVGTWLNTVAPSSVEVLEGTGIVRVITHAGPVKVTAWVWAPFGVEAPAVALTARAEVTDGATHQVGLYSLHNFHVGGTASQPGASGESATWDEASGSFTETGPSGYAIHAIALAPPTHHGLSPDNPYAALLAGKDLSDGAASGTMDDVVTGLQWEATLAPGGALEAGVLLTTGDALAWAKGGPAALLAQEQALWSGWVGALPPFAVSKPAWEQLARRVLPTLRMAQVREPNGPGGTPHGQILASMPPGQWNIAWVRDGAYAITALARTGHLAEARAALDFFYDGKAGDYADLVGHPYAVSVCRYYGNGREWSDGGETPAGPNIEYDNFGLLLWATRAWVDASGDDAWLSARWATLSEGVADVLVALLDPATGLLPADSSIWEHHWNGNQKRFAYTHVTAARGLCDAAALAARVGDGARAAAYAEAAHTLRASLLSEYVMPGGGLAGNLDEPPSLAVDASAIEAIPLGLIPPGGQVATATLSLLDTLAMKVTGHGYKRNDDLDWYDRQEWVFIDLRVALARRLRGEHAQADALLDWVASQSLLNHGLVAELYEETTADYEGAVPMAGYGAGAWLLALLETAPEPFDSLCPAPSQPAEDVGGADAGDAGEIGVDAASHADVGQTAGDASGDSQATDDASAERDASPEDGAEAHAGVTDTTAHDASTTDTADTPGDAAGSPRSSGGGCAVGPGPPASLLLLGSSILISHMARQRRRRRG
ncbi:MAG: hypothetical protein AMXMBFR64_46210 [Myxococcales bacterium]